MKYLYCIYFKLKKNSKNAEILTKIATLYVDKGNIEMAKLYFKFALNINKTEINKYLKNILNNTKKTNFNDGLSGFDINDNDEIIKYLNIAINIVEQNDSYLSNMHHRNLNDYINSLLHYYRLYKSENIELQIALCFEKIKDYDKARLWYHKYYIKNLSNPNHIFRWNIV